MKLSNKYLRSLENYLEWVKVKTLASGTFQESSKPLPKIEVEQNGLSAGEALCTWESTGKSCNVSLEDSKLLNKYIKGKSQKDWWTKERGWMDKHSVYIPEEFLGLLGPLPFIELFGRTPITRLVRYYHDNTYKLWEFWLDSKMCSKVKQWDMWYYERDDRDSAIHNAWRVFSVKWIQPAFFKTKKSLSRKTKNCSFPQTNRRIRT